jgi:hypothetical protein
VLKVLGVEAEEEEEAVIGKGRTKFSRCLQTRIALYPPKRREVVNSPIVR